jgi:hypothetical protein
MTSGDWVLLGVTLFTVMSGSLGGMVRYFNGRLKEERQSREALASNLSTFKEQVADKYPSYQRLNDLLRPISEGIDELKEDMRGLFARIDQKQDKS